MSSPTPVDYSAALQREDGLRPSDLDDGLICGWVFDPGDDDDPDGAHARPLDLDGARQWLLERAEAERAQLVVGPDDDGTPAEVAAPPRSFVWLHFNFANRAAERWLQSCVPDLEAYFETLRAGPQGTRIERADEAMIALVNDVQFDFDFEPTDIATLWTHVDERLILTGRRQPLRSVDDLRIAIRRGGRARSTADLLAQLLRLQAEVLVGVVRGVTSRVDDIEDRLLASRLQVRRTRLGPLRRLLVRLQRLLVPEPAALFRLLQHPPGWMAELDVQDLREASEEFSVVLRDMVSLQERIKLLQEEIAAQVNEENNRSLYLLTVVTVLALPINLTAGLLGMNVGGIPLAEHPHGFAVVTALVVGITALGGWIAFRRRRDDD